MKKSNRKLSYLWIVLILGLVVFMTSLFRVDPDYFWHIKAGEYMIHHGVLKKDIFSWFVAGKYWMSHEWLFEVFLAFLKNIFHSFHPLVYCFLGMGGLLFLLFYPNRESLDKNIPYSLIYLLFFFLLFLGFIQARPHLISFSFLALTIWFCYDLYQKEDSKKIYFLPFIAMLWANYHGGSSNLSYLFCFLFLIGGSFSFQFKKMEAKKMSKKKQKKFFLIMILCMIAICINVHGFKMFLYPYQNMADTTMIQNISEWQSTSLNEWYHYVYYAFLLFMIFTLLLSDRKIQFMDFILLGVTTYLGLKSIRFWPYTYIVMSYVIFSYVSKRKVDVGTDFSMILLSFLAFGVAGYRFYQNIPISYELDLKPSIIQQIKEEQPKRLFNMYGYGGELIYHDIPVFIDGRADLYGKYNYKDYLNLSMLQGDYVSIIDKYNFDYYLVDEDYPIAYYLKYHDEFEEIYHGSNIVFYKKNS